MFLDHFSLRVSQIKQNFQSSLLDHITARLKNAEYTFDSLLYSDEDYAKISIKNNQLHFHRKFQLHYTSYDGIREQETIKPFLQVLSPDNIVSGNSDHCMIMLASSEDDKIAGDHPFWYAQVLGIFHCSAYSSPLLEFKRLDILWVRWFGRETGFSSGPAARRLDKVGFVEGANNGTSPFGFIDPNDVIRSIHLIPSFHEGREPGLLGTPSFVQAELGDWSFYYVGR